MRIVLAILVLIIGVLLACYVGGWVLFIKPILAACAAFDAGTLTATVLGVTVIKCLLASAVASVIIAVAYVIAKILADY